MFQLLLIFQYFFMIKKNLNNPYQTFILFLLISLKIIFLNNINELNFKREN
jgi:hypothetical protein